MVDKEIVVQKYGGSSVATPEKIRIVAEYIKMTAKNKRVVVVVSAMGKETDRLIQMAKEIYDGDPPRQELDKLLVTGEQQSAPLLAMALMRLGVDAVSLTGREIMLEADTIGRVKRISGANEIKTFLDQDNVVIVAGFQGIEKSTGRIVTLGRGGSDITAIVVASSLGENYCEIYTDVDGVYTIDPRVIPQAKRFNRIPYDQMIQLSGAGAGVMMDRSVILAQNLGVKIRVLLSPSFGQTTKGTLIYSGSTLEEMEGLEFQAGLAIQKERLIKISDVPNRPGVACTILGLLSDINIIDAAQVSGEEKTDISLLCLPEDSSLILSKLHESTELEEFRNGIKISEALEVAGLTLVHPLMKEETGYLHRVSKAIADKGVNIEMFSSSGITILAIVKEEYLQETARSLGEEFKLI